MVVSIRKLFLFWLPIYLWALFSLSFVHANYLSGKIEMQNMSTGERMLFMHEKTVLGYSRLFQSIREKIDVQ
ncbi:MAG: hypothetical protein EOM55_04175 [Clostridia bacterium]|nr:hypothetical protein [Clostridia bacterium]